MTVAPVAFDHIAALTDRFGTFEHALLAVPRREHGYCTDDAARVLVVAAREQDPTIAVRQLARGALRFVAEAQGVTGASRNRRRANGRWHGRRSVEDCWGRSLWGLGTAAARSPGWLGQDALTYFEHATEQRSPWPRAMAFAALGAAEVVSAHPGHRRALSLLGDAVDVIGSLKTDETWGWPEARLSYANAALAEALIAAGGPLGRPDLLESGLAMLGWLLERETVDGHLSVTPAGGAGPDDGPGFDQQPIEVACMADACARAATVTGDPRWTEGVRLAAAWFDGDNDAMAVMWDPTTGGGYDGLEPTGVNRNQGAESTLALLSTRQHARLLPQPT